MQSRAHCSSCGTIFYADESGEVIPNSYRVYKESLKWGRLKSESCAPEATRSWEVAENSYSSEYLLIGNDVTEFDPFFEAIQSRVKNFEVYLASECEILARFIPDIDLDDIEYWYEFSIEVGSLRTEIVMIFLTAIENHPAFVHIGNGYCKYRKIIN